MHSLDSSSFSKTKFKFLFKHCHVGRRCASGLKYIISVSKLKAATDAYLMVFGDHLTAPVNEKEGKTMEKQNSSN